VGSAALAAAGAQAVERDGQQARRALSSSALAGRRRSG